MEFFDVRFTLFQVKEIEPIDIFVRRDHFVFFYIE